MIYIPHFLNLIVFGILLSTCNVFSPIGSPVANEIRMDGDPLVRGAYIARSSNCISCHTSVPEGSPPLGGGRPIITKYGTFFSPNITPDPVNGIGQWNLEDFRKALTKGISPQGNHYYPVFPYTSFNAMSAADLEDLWKYLESIRPVKMVNRQHEIKFPFSSPLAPLFWKKAFFKPKPFQSNPEKSKHWNRGLYLVEVLGHCQECHSPRNFLGAVRNKAAYSGAKHPTDDGYIPNITPDPTSGIGDWDEEDISWFLQAGFLPNGDVASGIMAEIIEKGTSLLTKSDREAIATFLKSLTPVRNPSLVRDPDTYDIEEDW
ncbi:MAG: cytochrome c [Pseudomonadota bacterium]|nr:cytochrome c [Pseudomonadota bacterium]